MFLVTCKLILLYELHALSLLVVWRRDVLNNPSYIVNTYVHFIHHYSLSDQPLIYCCVRSSHETLVKALESAHPYSFNQSRPTVQYKPI